MLYANKTRYSRTQHKMAHIFAYDSNRSLRLHARLLGVACVHFVCTLHRVLNASVRALAVVWRPARHHFRIQPYSRYTCGQSRPRGDDRKPTDEYHPLCAYTRTHVRLLASCCAVTVALIYSFNILKLYHPYCGMCVLVRVRESVRRKNHTTKPTETGEYDCISPCVCAWHASGITALGRR